MAQTLSDIERHPWNDHFEWRTPAGPYQMLSAEQVRKFDEDGYVVLEDVFDADQIAAILPDIDEYEAQTDAFLQGLDGGRISIAETGAITFTLFPVTRSRACSSFAADEVFARLCHDLVGDDADLYHDQAVYKKPEKPRRFPWHQDNGYTFVEPQQYLTCWVALTDATVENGCPHVIPGAHRKGTLLHHYVEPLGWECFSDPAESVPAPVGAGGIVVFSSLTPHLTGPNTTADVRKAYILQFCPTGASVLTGDPHAGAADGRTPCDADRQFPVVRGGLPVGPPDFP